MKLCISKIHLGRYRIEVLDDNNQVVSGTDGGLALVMMWISDWVAKDEHLQYLSDQRKSSDEIGAAAVDRALNELDPGMREAYLKLEAKRANRTTKLLAETFPKAKADR